MSNAEGLSVPALPEQAELLPKHGGQEMELITREIEATLPPLYSQENVPDPVALVKLFDPLGRCTFYILEGSRQPDGDLLLFGFCRSALGPDCDELGYASLRELESVRRPLGLGFERDLYFKPMLLSQIRAVVGGAKRVRCNDGLGRPARTGDPWRNLR